MFIARIVPFLNAWMFTTETILPFPGSAGQRLQEIYGLVIPQLVFVRKYHEDHKRGVAVDSIPSTAQRSNPALSCFPAYANQ